MGIFHELVTVINLAPVPLSVTFDGQQSTIPVGESALPKIAIPYAKNQNPVMGSADPNNPSLSGAQYLISVKGSKRDRQTVLNPDEWAAHLDAPCRLNQDDFFEDRLVPGERVVVRGKGRKVQARSLFDAGVKERMSPDDTVQ